MGLSTSPISDNQIDGQSTKLLRNLKLFDGVTFQEGKAVLVENGKVSLIVEDDQLRHDVANAEDLGGRLLVPGFVDVQVNGGGGVMFNDEQSTNALASIANGHRKFGTTSLLPHLSPTALKTCKPLHAL